jgi:hypothetical protein
MLHTLKHLANDRSDVNRMSLGAVNGRSMGVSHGNGMRPPALVAPTPLAGACLTNKKDGVCRPPSPETPQEGLLAAHPVAYPLPSAPLNKGETSRWPSARAIHL